MAEEPDGNQVWADDDHDSAYGSNIHSLTSSVASSVYAYRQENGRTYHAYKDGTYAYPNDELEMDRLDLQHHLFLLTLNDKLHLAPITSDPQVVLDVGTGSGIWAIEFADRKPSAFVIANDLSPTQPDSVPPNLQFEVDDANDTWTHSRRFDFIHCRQHHCAIEEHELFRQSYEFLKPGGWLEMQELVLPVGCDDGTLSEDSSLWKWSNLLFEATVKIDQPANKPLQYETWMREAGFLNTKSVHYKWPSNTWPKDKRLKTMGLVNLYNTLKGLQAFTIAMFTRVLGWRPEEVEVLLAGVRKEIQDPRIHAYWSIYVVYGQKPPMEAPD